MNNHYGSFTFVFIKPHALREGKSNVIRQILIENGFGIITDTLEQLSESKVVQLYDLVNLLGEDGAYSHLATYANSMDRIRCFIVWANLEDASMQLNLLKGKIDPENNISRGLRSEYGRDIYFNAIHSSDSEEEAFREINIINPYLIELALSNSLYKDVFYSRLEKIFSKRIDELSFNIK